MIISLHLADVGLRNAVSALRRPPQADPSRGLRWSTAAAVLSLGHVPPRPLTGRIGFIAAWSDDSALDTFLTDHPWRENLAGGYEVRLQPMRSFGSWAAVPELQIGHEERSPDEPVAALTLGRLRASQAARFFRASALAERPLLTHPARLLSVGLARPPLLSTFSLWSTVAGMQDYADHDAGGHAQASARHRDKPLHHESCLAASALPLSRHLDRCRPLSRQHPDRRLGRRRHPWITPQCFTRDVTTDETPESSTSPVSRYAIGTCACPGDASGHDT